MGQPIARFQIFVQFRPFPLSLFLRTIAHELTTMTVIAPARANPHSPILSLFHLSPQIASPFSQLRTRVFHAAPSQPFGWSPIPWPADFRRRFLVSRVACSHCFTSCNDIAGLHDTAGLRGCSDWTRLRRFSPVKALE